MWERNITSKSTDIILLTIIAILLLLVGIPTVQKLTNATSNISDENCLIDPYVEYQDTLAPSEKPSIKINFSLNPSCSDVTGYKVYTTYNLFDGKYNNHVKRYYVLYNKALQWNGCVYPSRNNDNQNCYLHEENGSITSCYTWDEIKDKTKESDDFDPRYKFVTKQRLDNELCEFESIPDRDALCYFFDDELIGDFKIKTEDSHQEASISNLEFNTTYQIKVSIVRGQKEGQKISLNDNVFFSSPSDIRVQNFNKKVQGNQITKDEAYRSFFSKPKIKKGSRLIAPTRFNNESTPYQAGNTATILRLEDTLYRGYGYDIFYSVIGRGYDTKPQMVQPEELFIYKNCKLNLDVLNEQYNGDDKVYITCKETNPQIIELIKRKSKCSQTAENTLNCLSPDYGISIALLGKTRPSNISVSINRADTVSSATTLNVSWLLLQNGFYKNEPYPLGLHLRKIITEMLVAHIQGETVEKLRSRLTTRKEELTIESALRDYPLYKQFQVNVLSKIYDSAITATKANGSKLSVTKNYIKNYITKIFSLIDNLCTSELENHYCTGTDSTGFIDSILNISPILKKAFLESYNQEQKKWKWDLYADNIVLENIADFELFQVRLLNDFISPKSKITSFINGGELFSYEPSSLPLYNGKDKYGNPYSYYTNKNCSQNSEWCDMREEWVKDLSKNFARQQRVLTDKFSSFLPKNLFKKPYIYYLTAQLFPSSTRRNRHEVLYAEIGNTAFDLICSEKYLTYHNRNDMYLSNISAQRQRNQYLNRGEEYFNHYFSTYQGTIYLHLNGAMYGYLKLGYMTGSVGWCNYYHAPSYTEEPTLTDLPASIKDTLAVSKVAAEFSYLDDFLKNSKIITINGQVAENADLSANDNIITVVRKEYGKQHWLALGVSKDFVTRELRLDINNHQFDISASPAGNLYEIVFTDEYGEIQEDKNKNGEYKIRLIDNAKTFTLMSEGDESLTNMKQFGDFYIPIVVDPIPEKTPEATHEPTIKPTLEPIPEQTPEPTLEQTSEQTPEQTPKQTLDPTLEPSLDIKEKCNEISLVDLKNDLLNSNYNSFVLKQIKKSRIRRRKQLKNAKELFQSFNEIINGISETIEICHTPYQISHLQYETDLNNAKSTLKKIFNLTSRVIKQIGKKKKKLNKKNQSFYNEKLSLIDQYLNID